LARHRCVKDGAKAAELFSSAADAGDLDTKYNLVVCYEHGAGVRMDETKAVERYRRAVDGGDASGICSLGSCYRRVSGVTKDTTKTTFDVYNRAAANGYINAIHNPVRTVHVARVLERTQSELLKLYASAADAGHVGAIRNPRNELRVWLRGRHEQFDG
jgi:TPR repeat protein